jgi:hypothetical protein
VPIPQGPAAGGARDCFEGVSKYKDRSTAADLHEAIQQAARAAARHRRLRRGQTVDFEVTRIQIVVGNPNVKAYKVEITETG